MYISEKDLQALGIETARLWILPKSTVILRPTFESDDSCKTNSERAIPLYQPAKAPISTISPSGSTCLSARSTDLVKMEISELLIVHVIGSIE